MEFAETRQRQFAVLQVNVQLPVRGSKAQRAQILHYNKVILAVFVGGQASGMGIEVSLVSL